MAVTLAYEHSWRSSLTVQCVSLQNTRSRLTQTGKDLGKSPSSAPAQSSLGHGLRPGCTRLYWIRAWNPQWWIWSNPVRPQLQHLLVLMGKCLLLSPAWAIHVSACATLPCFPTTHSCEESSCVFSIPPISAGDAARCSWSHPFSWLKQPQSHSLSPQWKGSGPTASVAFPQLLSCYLYIYCIGGDQNCN